MMTIGGRTIETAIETLAASIRAMSDDMHRLTAARDKWQGRANVVLEDNNKLVAERDEALDKLTYARSGIAKLDAELEDAKRRLKQANDHNKMLRDQNQQLQAALKKARIASLYLPDGWRKTVAENLRAQGIDDSAEPQFTAQSAMEEKLRANDPTAQGIYAQSPAGPVCVGYTTSELANAAAVVEGDLELERTARGEPMTGRCPQCGGEGFFDLGRTPLAKGVGKLQCDRCKGTGHVLVADDSPKIADAERKLAVSFGDSPGRGAEA